MIRLLADENFDHDIVRGVCAAGPSWIWFEHRQWDCRRPLTPKWASREQRVVLSHDVNTMTAFAMKRLTLGDPMAGLFIVHQEGAALSKIIHDMPFENAPLPGSQTASQLPNIYKAPTSVGLC